MCTAPFDVVTKFYTVSLEGECFKGSTKLTVGGNLGEFLVSPVC